MFESVFAIDGGGSRLKWGVITDGRITTSGIVPSAHGTASEHARRLLEMHSQHGQDLPMAISWASGLNTGCSVEELRSALDAVGAPVSVVADDMEAAGLGEAAGRDIALLQVGSGVGGSIVCDGKVTKCIIGHMVFREDGIPCNSGMRGTVDAYLGWKPLLRRLASLDPPATAENPRDLLLLATERADAACLLEDALEAAGFAAGVLGACSGADTLVLAGGVAAAWDQVLIEAVQDGLSKRLWPARAAAIEVELSTQREEAPLLGLWHLACRS